MTLECVDTQDVFSLSAKGEGQLKAGSTLLPSVALELLVLFNGRLNLGEVLTRSGRDHSAARAVAQRLALEGYLDLAHGMLDTGIDFSRFFATEPAAPTPAAVDGARVEAEGGAQRLSADGYYVSIARRRADKTWHPGMRPAAVLAVEDDPLMQRMLSLLLTEAGFVPRLAGNREEIVLALRTQPSPDAVLLDVMLPDADGFDVLARLKQHPVLKSIPVVMLTAKATRDDVLRGLAGGADGYITKPFDNDMLINGVKAVLGLH